MRAWWNWHRMWTKQNLSSANIPNGSVERCFNMGKLEVVLFLRLTLVSNILNEKVEPWMGGLFLFLLRLFDKKRTDECVPSPGPCALACRLGKDTTPVFMLSSTCSCTRLLILIHFISFCCCLIGVFHGDRYS
jgi:hypothetical protein